jgi:hypothetical protein
LLSFSRICNPNLPSQTVAHRTRQLEAWLADALQNFLIHQEGQISRIPKPVRSITMREFQKYDGDVQAALRGLQQAKLGGGPFGGEMDKNTRKRKWVASQEAEAHASGSGSADIDAESSKAAKNGMFIVLCSTASDRSIFFFENPIVQHAWERAHQERNQARQLVLEQPNARVFLRRTGHQAQ